ncbi:NnrU family protein [Maritalea sp.]|uniref:NnrU family protein n=1 Tax=Maritalea sp. TaxID=2003361 RepID=UPI003EF94909
MINFITALAAFLGAHTLPRATGFRDWGMDRFGRKIYMAAYSIASIGLLVWLIIAAQNAPYIGLWPTTQFTVALAILIMLVSCILFASAVTRANSLSIAFRGGETDIDSPGILALVRHPIVLTFLLWSLAHLLVNGDVIGLILFGGMLAFSFIGMRAVEKRARNKLSPEAFAKFSSLTTGPLPARIKRAMSFKLIAEIVAGVLAFFVLLFAHEFAIGVSPLAYF